MLKKTLLFLLLSSCSTYVAIPKIENKENISPLKAWHHVLERYVDQQGRVDFYSLQKKPDNLYIYLNYIATNGPFSTPQKFPSKWSKLAHYINSYNALAMYNVLYAKIPKNLNGIVSKAKFFYFTKFKIDGTYTSLYNYEHNTIRILGEERIHFALNCMSLGCPRLPRKPFEATDLDMQLTKEAHSFLNQKHNVYIDKHKKTVFVSELLNFFEEDFLAKSSSIIAYINQYRIAKIPDDYQVEYIPYNWSIVQQ